MAKLIQIMCVKKDGTFITEISGTVANPTDGKPVPKLFEASERPADLWFRFQNGKEDMIVVQTYLDNRTGKKISHFILADPDKRIKNYLEKFQPCK
ncbi:MAG: hypothetical protein LV477_03000 [Candidatus Nitrosotalea sp.]|nr:hypothetical protein [Candidatus Nitrosotalea sp.]